MQGIFASNSDGAQTEMLAMLDWDFLVFDGEHSFLEPKELTDFSRTCELRFSHADCSYAGLPPADGQSIFRRWRSWGYFSNDKQR